MRLKLYATHQLKCQHDIQVHGACHAVFPITIRKKTCVISTLMISGKKRQNHESLGHELTWLHLRFYPKGRSDAWQVAPQRFRYKVMNPQLWNLNKTALDRLEDLLGLIPKSIFFPHLNVLRLKARRTFEKTVRHRHIMTYHTSWSSDSSICQISYGSWLNLHWSSYILILGGYAATPPTIKYG